MGLHLGYGSDERSAIAFFSRVNFPIVSSLTLLPNVVMKRRYANFSEIVQPVEARGPVAWPETHESAV